MHLAQIDIDDLAPHSGVRRGLKVFHRGETDDLGLDSACGGGWRMAQRGGDQGLGVVADDGGRAFAPLPADQREFFDADVLEAVGAQIVGGPGGGVLFGFRSRRARAEPGRQLGDVVQGDVGAQGRVANGDRPLHRRGVLGLSQGGEGGDAQGDGAGGQQTKGHGRGSTWKAATLERVSRSGNRVPPSPAT